jgi:hypothetical protein
MTEQILKAALCAITLFFAPVIPLLILIGFAIVADTVFGIIASKKNGTPIISRKLSRIVSKSVVYMTLILLAYGIDYVLLNMIFLKWLSIPWLFTKISAVIITFVEIFSIDEKIRSFNDGKGIWYFIKQMLKGLKQLTSDVKEIKEDIKDIKDI